MWGSKNTLELITIVKPQKFLPTQALSFTRPPYPIQHIGQKQDAPGIWREWEGVIFFISLNLKGK